MIADEIKSFNQELLDKKNLKIILQLFGKTFKVHHIDDNTRIIINKPSSLNAHYRTIGIEYSGLILLLRQNFTEKKTMTALYKLEQAIIELVKTNRDIVALARDFDSQWSEKEER